MEAPLIAYLILKALQINYPMVEALRDFEPGTCGASDRCHCTLSQLGNYKEISAGRGSFEDFRKGTFEKWKEVLNVFVMRVSCLFDEEGILIHDKYKELVNPYSVYQCQKKYIEEGNVRILSAFPEFLLDYFPVKFWNACIKCSEKPFKHCKRR